MRTKIISTLKFVKLLHLKGNFHPNSDVDRLYMSRGNSARRLKRIKTLFESRTVSIKQHLKLNSKRSQLLKYVNKREQDPIIRVFQELMRNNNINTDTLEKKSLSKI